MIDIVSEIDAVQREVGRGTRSRPARAASVLLRRTYDAPIDDVWDALTNPERIGRWFLPISGDYRVGGRYQFEGNAGGEIVVLRPTEPAARHVGLRRRPATRDVSEVEVRLTPAGDEATDFELEHTAVVPDEMWAQYGPGAVGVGWDRGCSGWRCTCGRRLHRGSDRLAGVGRGPRVLDAQQRGMGRGEPAAGADEETVARAVANTTRSTRRHPTRRIERRLRGHAFSSCFICLAMNRRAPRVQAVEPVHELGVPADHHAEGVALHAVEDDPGGLVGREDLGDLRSAAHGRDVDAGVGRDVGRRRHPGTPPSRGRWCRAISAWRPSVISLTAAFDAP